MSEPMTPAEIARGLSGAQKRALLWLPKSCGATGWRRDDMGDECATLARGMPKDAHLTSYMPMLASFRLTPLGLAVRAELERKEKQDA